MHRLKVGTVYKTCNCCSVKEPTEVLNYTTTAIALYTSIHKSIGGISEDSPTCQTRLLGFAKCECKNTFLVG